MSLVWKGIYKNKNQLPVGELPERAVKFKEPNSMLMINLVASLFVIPVIIVIVLAISLKYLISGDMQSPNWFNLWAFITACIMIVPHELLHAAAFPKKAEVELWFSPKNLMAFVISTYPVSKLRFILISLLPNATFGLIPLIVWVFLPTSYSQLGDFLFSFAVVSLLFGVGDYLNVFNAIFQMPRGSITQLSGMNSYWFMPKTNETKYKKSIK